MAARKPPRDVGSPATGGRSLRDQVKALSHLLTPEGATQARPTRPRPAPRAADDAVTFEQLVAGAAGGRSGREAGAEPAPPSAGETFAPARERGPRLWVEHGEGVVRGRADDVPPSVLQELERGRVVPRRQIDLHRHSAASARETLDREVAAARRDGVPCVLVVCGRGTHSAPGIPVLPDVAVERLSEELAADVLAFASAPRKWGGQGALVVLLRALAKASEEPQR